MKTLLYIFRTLILFITVMIVHVTILPASLAAGWVHSILFLSTMLMIYEEWRWSIGLTLFGGTLSDLTGVFPFGIELGALTVSMIILTLIHTRFITSNGSIHLLLKIILATILYHVIREIFLAGAIQLHFSPMLLPSITTESRIMMQQIFIHVILGILIIRVTIWGRSSVQHKFL